MRRVVNELVALSERHAIGSCRWLTGRRSRLMELRRVLFRQRIAATFVLERMNDYRSALRRIARYALCIFQLLLIVTIDRSDVMQAELFPDRVRQDQALDRGLDLARNFPRFVAVRQTREEVLTETGEALILRIEHDAVAPFGEPSDVLGDRPTVVVEDHHQPLRIDVADVVERLVTRPGGERSVADDGDHERLGRVVLRRNRDAEGVGESGAGMAGRQRVVLALGRLGKSGKAAYRSDGSELFVSAGDEFVRVGLIGRVPDQPIFRAVKHAVDCECQLDGTEVGGQMAAALGDRLDDRVATLGRQLRNFVVAERVEVPWRCNAFDDGHDSPRGGKD